MVNLAKANLQDYIFQTSTAATTITVASTTSIALGTISYHKLTITPLCFHYHPSCVRPSTQHSPTRAESGPAPVLNSGLSDSRSCSHHCSHRNCCGSRRSIGSSCRSVTGKINKTKREYQDRDQS